MMSLQKRVGRQMRLFFSPTRQLKYFTVSADCMKMMQGTYDRSSAWSDLLFFTIYCNRVLDSELVLRFYHVRHPPKPPFVS